MRIFKSSTLANKIYKKVFGRDEGVSATQYWKKRVAKYGRHSVLNIGHSHDEFDAVTKTQKDFLFPLLRDHLTGEEKSILDFGCGPGRFTSDLANILSGQAIGVDPISELIDLAPKTGNVEYRTMLGRDIPADDNSMDIVWVCLVLGGITEDDELIHIREEIIRVLKDGSLIFLVENTSDKPNNTYWKYRSEEFYLELFSAEKLEYVSKYYDLGERNSVFTGRKHV